MTDARRQRQRAAAEAYVQHMGERTAEQIEADRTMDEHNAEISLRGAESVVSVAPFGPLPDAAPGLPW